MLPRLEYSGGHGDDVLLDSGTAGESQRHPGPPQRPNKAPTWRDLSDSLAMREERRPSLWRLVRDFKSG